MKGSIASLTPLPDLLSQLADTLIILYFAGILNSKFR